MGRLTGICRLLPSYLIAMAGVENKESQGKSPRQTVET
jgi:hypothetical protein